MNDQPFVAEYFLALLVALPLVAAAIACMLRREWVGPAAAMASLVPLAAAVPVLIDFEISNGFQRVFDVEWIPQLGIHFAFALDGLNVFMVALTMIAWTVATFSASRREVDQPRLFYMLMALAQTGTLGAFLAQDLMLFVLFFDLLLVPFYLLVGVWGEGDRIAATTKFVIYTLVGSLLMFAAAIGLGVSLSSQTGRGLSFAFSDLAQGALPADTQKLIFAGFALALLIKMPLPPLHGWMPDTYKAAPLAVLIPLSAVVAKLGAYGFLRVVLPLLPDAAHDIRHVMLVLALTGIVYGSVMAFTQDHTRLVIGYSSIAQIGFVALGIFALDPKGAEGAVLQMINHGLVVIALFLIIGFLAERTAGNQLLSRMGGLARNAPVLASLFLITGLAALAMPGSPNFVGELYILFGAFDTAFVYGVIASIGVVLAAVYMIRFFIKSMHNPVAEGAESRELNDAEGALLIPVVLVVLVLSVYPQFVVERVRPAAEQSLSGIERPRPIATANDRGGESMTTGLEK